MVWCYFLTAVMVVLRQQKYHHHHTTKGHRRGQGYWEENEYEKLNLKIFLHIERINLSKVGISLHTKSS